MRILVVDDDPFAQRLFARQLERLGFSDVLTLGDAHNALTEIEQGRPRVDVVFCDLQMPEMDGVEFVRHLARMEFGGCVALVSGEARKILQAAEGLARAHQLRVVGSVTKPVNPGSLRRILDDCIRGGALSGIPETPPGQSCSPEDLRAAIAAGMLENHYQPKVNLATGSLAGVEALVRLRHPRYGLVFPDRFVGVAEAHGLIDDLTRAVLAQALEHVRTWLDSGMNIHVAVNLSMKNLESVEFPDEIVEQAKAMDIAPSAIILELTESALMDDARTSLDILARLRLKQVGLSIDDFGTGHSSLAKLHDLPFDELKIDRRFVCQATRDPDLRAIVDASLAIARDMGLRSVAEGVETREDWDYLREKGCDLAQGYFIARPMPPDHLLPWLVQWENRCPELLGA